MQNHTIAFHNGVNIPLLGYGTFLIEEGKEIESCVLQAIEAGYRHIDTASYYQNEAGVGKAIRQSGLTRDELFITTKVWNEDQRTNSVLEAFEKSMDLLQLEYVDLYLVHWPVKDKYVQTWKKIEEIYHSGRAKAIGVSNHQIHHLEAIMDECDVQPMINQVEYHPYLQQPDLHDFCQKNQIVLEAWAPLMRGIVNQVKLLKELSETYKKTPAQITLRWMIQNHVVTIPKSSNEGRIKENVDVFDFELSPEDMAKINGLNKNRRLGPDPDNFDF